MTKTRTYARVARLYDLLDLPFEYGRYRPIRRALFEGVLGSILDAGVGTGRNMPFYPPGGDVVGSDISPQMVARAPSRKAGRGVAAGVREGDRRPRGAGLGATGHGRGGELVDRVHQRTSFWQRLAMR